MTFVGAMFRCALLLGLCAAATAASPTKEAAAPAVSVTGGRVQGRLLPAPGGAVFKGIPYAAQPIGELRWRETQRVKPWKGVLQAGEFKHGCGAIGGQLAPAEPVFEVSDSATLNLEDCLYINVWTPAWPARDRLPVMFWINGGELAGGSAALRDGAESLAHNGVVLVSANYRGTPLGMLGHPELAAESPHHSSGHYGLSDEVAALRWVHDNIARFGGDPGNVTLIGESGGAHLTSMLLTSPRVKGLIHRAILESGPPMQAVRPYLRRDQVEQIGIVTAELLKAPATGQIRYLRSLPAMQIVAAMPAVRTRLLETTGQAYDWGADGYVIPQPPNEVWQSHRELPIPLLIGSNSNDTAATVAGDPARDPRSGPAETLAWKRRVLELFYEQDPDLLQRALQIYGVTMGPNEVSTYPPYGSPALQLGVDLNHRCSTALSVSLHSTVAPTWQFEFTRSTEGHPPVHTAELRYVFGFDLEDASARQYSDMMQRYWTNSARTGDPNGPGLPVWSRYDDATMPSMEFATEGAVQRFANRAVACAPFIEKYTRHPRLLSSGDDLRIRGTGGAL